jgi:apolipoprotein N-acyltransferase
MPQTPLVVAGVVLASLGFLAGFAGGVASMVARLARAVSSAGQRTSRPWWSGLFAGASFVCLGFGWTAVAVGAAWFGDQTTLVRCAVVVGPAVVGPLLAVVVVREALARRRRGG